MGDELRALKITNPEYVGLMGPFIKSFLDRVPMKNVTYETLYTFLANTVNHGHLMAQQGMRDGAELWVVFENNDPIAFAHWHVKQIPAISTVRCDYIFSWNRKKEPVKLLMKELINFASSHRCKYIDATLTNEAVFKVFSKVAEYNDLHLERDESINATVTRNVK